MTFKTIRLVTDSTCDLPPDVVRKYQIAVIPAFVNYGGRSYADDGVELDRQAYYEQMPTLPSHPTTAAPSPGLAASIIERQAEGADHLVMLTAPARLSGIHNAFRLGASNLPAERVTLIDSGTLSMGLGFQVLAGAEAAAETGDLSAVLDAVERARRHVRVFAVPETMEYLRRSGRVGWATASAAALLQIKPIVQVSEGEVESVARVRTFSKAVDKLIELAQGQFPAARLAILHANNPEGAAEIRSRLGSGIPAETYVINATPVIGTHIGPKALGIVTLSQGWRR